MGIKLLHVILPSISSLIVLVELDQLIEKIPGVSEAAVVGIPEPDHPENDMPVAIVVRESKHLSQNDVLEFVNSHVSDFKKLRGGVIFVNTLQDYKVITD